MTLAWRLAAAVVVLLGLSGCNNVVSNEPWFTDADTLGAPELRDGLWVTISEDDCRVKLERPAERWPDCGDSFYVRGHDVLHMEWNEIDANGRDRRVFDKWESVPLFVAAGDPVILQFDGGSEPRAPDPDEIFIDDDEPHWRYSYAAMRPVELDNQGNVVAFEYWIVQCGPLQREVEAGVEYTIDDLTEGYVTEQSFPGLTVVGEKCTAESADALRRAAASSETDQPRQVRWVRDGWH